MSIEDLKEMMSDNVEDSLINMIEAVLNEFTHPENIYYDDRKFMLDLYKHFSVINEYASKNSIRMQKVELLNDKEMMFNNIIFYLRETLDDVTMKFLKIGFNRSDEDAKLLIENNYYYELNDPEFNQVQELLNKIRDLIILTEFDNPRYKSRILKKLEEFQSELHKHMDNIDKFWVIIGELNNAKQMLGENSQPILNNLKVLIDIFQSAHQLALGLPPMPSVNLLVEFNINSKEDKNSIKRSKKDKSNSDNSRQESD